MYNTDLPRRAELPSSAQLKRSTWIASITAAAVLAFVVLPSEYAVDPTGIGRVLGLTQMGEIKAQLAAEAKLDAPSAEGSVPSSSELQLIARLDRIEALLGNLGTRPDALPGEAPEPAPATGATPAPMAAPAPQVAEPQPASPEWQDEVSFTLAPGEGAEFKLVMREGAKAEFFWTANGAVVNFDTHGDGGGQSVSYEKGRGVGEQRGVLEAAFTGNHGWFWRNRSAEPLTMTLRTRGAYSELKRLI